MINLSRLHCYKNGRLWLQDVETKEEEKAKVEARQTGWEVVHVERV